ncbi:MULTISPECIES: DUF3551 domain-containing protein [unclassified Bradyrhizobium]|uniref:DUF3551 domain-containing protein n=1 Tax=unclassified Bradyrhizobium TaxID=2631580 RepID=UPI0024792AE3|nr:MULTISPECIES: DUF3551 domain-containing protein [unclassified Bradyrhizobium]WGR69743.1 DUF3551 domain-containing protein [Bradyrhizobium sp. ISRA426]WGR81799.1 DUF3551 domain-containing protein [Bradyrhizobium sp. ISRA430]WGR84985.1 DUF3551 domain-containing protein [Bradyrhizobium sp. ISRA432]
MLKPIVAISALVTLLVAGSARAQTYAGGSPVCLRVFGELEGERMDCIFPSFAQCQASALGRPATCLRNPYFAQAAPRRSGVRPMSSQYPRPHQ